MDKEERRFYDACLNEGMEDMSYAITAALRAFRRWRTGKALDNDYQNQNANRVL